jgi:ubiquinone/menaquinone biosynthesis C-methylase UbiE
VDKVTAQEKHWQDKENVEDYSRWRSISSWLVYAPFARRIAASIGPLAPGSTIVDLGTGPGLLSVELHKHYPQAAIIGVDPSAAMLDKARANAAKAGINEFQVKPGRAEEIPLEEASVDLLVSQSSFHEWTSQQKGLSEIYRVLKPGGGVIVRDYNRAWISGWRGAVLGRIHHLHMFRFTVDDVASLLRDAGFIDVEADGGMQLYARGLKPQGASDGAG